MSRVGKKPIEIPAGVEVTVNGSVVVIKKGSNAIEVDNIPRFIRRVTGDVIVLNQSIPSPAIGQTVKRNPINDMFFNQRRFVIDSLTNMQGMTTRDRSRGRSRLI